MVIEYQKKRYAVVGEGDVYYICTEVWEEDQGESFYVPKKGSKIIQTYKKQKRVNVNIAQNLIDLSKRVRKQASEIENTGHADTQELIDVAYDLLKVTEHYKLTKERNR